MIDNFYLVYANLKKFSLTLSKWKKVWFFSLFLAIQLLIIFGNSFSGYFDCRLFDFAKRNLAKYWASSGAVVILAIDTETLEGVRERWPWSRKKFAELIMKINACKPKAVVFDVVWQHSEKEGFSQGDEDLAAAIGMSGNVALVGFMEETLTLFGTEKRQFRSLKKFRNAAFCDGYIRSYIDGDAKIRRFSLQDYSSDETSLQIKLA
ncbi:MAG: CHASE2 domain-containing protein, partial [Candidatus Riflebacteria bacterium]